MYEGLVWLVKIVRIGVISGGLIENGIFKIDWLIGVVFDEVDVMVFDLYGCLFMVWIIDLL